MFPPKKRPGIGVMIALGRGDSAPPKYKGGDGVGSPASMKNDAQETPEGEEEFHGGGAAKPTPESVNYRTEEESCGNCEYLQGADCRFLGQPVGPGDSCNRFEAKGEDERGEHAASGMDSEGAGDVESYGR